MIRLGDLKYIRNSKGSSELYNLENDPTEANDLTDEPSDMGAILAEHLAHWMESTAPQVTEQPSSLSAEEIERLRALGYIR